MNSKQRVINAINHKEPDRVPLDINVRDELKTGLLDFFKINKWERLLEKLNIDIRRIDGFFDYMPVKEFQDKTYYDMWKIKRKNYMPIENPLRTAINIEQIESFKFPDPGDIDYDKYAKECEDASSAGYAVMGGSASTVFATACDLMGMDNLFIQMIDNKEFTALLLEKITNFYFEVSRRIFEKAKRNIDIFVIYDDFGGQDSLILSKEMWKQYIFPNLKRIIDQAKEHGLKVMLHSCGCISELIPDLIDAGIDILDPIQPNARGMDILELNKKYGSKITFHGNIDTQITLPNGSTEDVKNEVLKLIENVAPGGGLIIAPSQIIQSDVPFENIKSLYNTAYEYGNYGSLGKPVH